MSLYIRHRDQMTCQNCLTKYDLSDNMLDAAHCYTRSYKSTRWDEDNILTLCKKCHMYFDGHSSWGMESHKQELKELFRKKLGDERFDLLTYRALNPRKMDETLVVIGMKMKLEKMGVQW